MSLVDALQLIVTVILAIVTVRQANVTHRLEQRLYRLNTDLDQRIQRLHRAREAVIQQHKAKIFMVEYQYDGHKQEGRPDQLYIEKTAEWSACSAELKGLAVAIDDQELIRLVFEDRIANPLEREELRAQQLHTRISQLLLEATADAPAGKPGDDWQTT